MSVQAIDPREAARRLARLERAGLDRPVTWSADAGASGAKSSMWSAPFVLERVDSVVRRAEAAHVSDSALGGLLSVLASASAPFVHVLAVSGGQLAVHLGTSSAACAPDRFRAALAGALPGARTSAVDPAALRSSLRKLSFAATLLGAPGRQATAVGDSLAQAIGAEEFAFVLVAEPVAASVIGQLRARVLEEVLEMTPFLKLNQALVVRTRETVTSEHANPALERYVRGLERILEELGRSSEAGLWRTTVTLAARDEVTLARVQAAAGAAWFAEDGARIEPVRVQRLPAPLAELALQLRPLAPLVCADDTATGEPLLEPLFGGLVTPLSGRRLAALCALPGEEYPGFGVRRRSRFQVALPRAVEPSLLIGEITDLGRGTGVACSFDRELLCKHVMIAGVTGSGKSTTCRSLLLQLAAGPNPVPFLVIEPAKREYRGLLGHPELAHLLVFTPGEESESPLRINPFEVPAGANVQVHLDLLRAAFQAAFPMYPPMPQVLERCLHEVYADHGWDLLRNTRRGGVGTADDFPTLTDLEAKIDPVVDAMGYDAKITQDIKAALKARVGSLRIGGKGAFLDCWRSTPLSELLQRPVVLELEGIADDEEKAFVLALVLMNLYEYRVAAARAGDDRSQLRHVTLFEEAHRLLARVADQGGNPDAVNTKAKAVEVFANMLSEIRAYGEGIVVAEQIPSKLTTDVVKNTALKLVHRTVAAEDRELLGTSMKLSPAQREDLAVLGTGEAVVFCEGFDGPGLVRVAPLKAHPKAPTGAQLRAANLAWRAEHDVAFGKYSSCAACPSKCLRTDAARDLAQRPGVRRVLDLLDASLLLDAEGFPVMWSALRTRAEQAEPSLRGRAAERDEVLTCMLVQWGEGRVTRAASSPDTRRRDDDLVDAFRTLVGELFAECGRASAGAGTRTAAQRLARRLRELRARPHGPYAACEGTCRNVCGVRLAGATLAGEASLSGAVATEYARDGDDRFARVRATMRAQIRAWSGASEASLDALAICTFVHLCQDAGLSGDDARWATTRLSRA
ncbi:MAG: ATP-binding protein [Candidatus Eisenbacteria bacterium]|uniref:ATP-binding protein n=1 Tax=Eiseniibacteriota bacterium TaxID=2212470 RepID=A0A933WAQ9_UNCEI|nr:ATP-binding protein [Candidatus Eisenbacteria bacterium]